MDDLNITFNASFRNTDYDYQQDRDGSFYDIDNIGMPVWANSAGGDVGQDNDTRGWEFLVEGAANDRLDFTFGVNYFHELARNGDGACPESVGEQRLRGPSFRDACRRGREPRSCSGGR